MKKTLDILIKLDYIIDGGERQGGLGRFNLHRTSLLTKQSILFLTLTSMTKREKWLWTGAVLMIFGISYAPLFLIGFPIMASNLLNN